MELHKHPGGPDWAQDHGIVCVWHLSQDELHVGNGSGTLAIYTDIPRTQRTIA